MTKISAVKVRFFASLCLGLAVIVGASACQARPSNLPSAQPTGTLPHDYAAAIQSGGLERTYRAHLPTSYNATQSLPLVLVLHGGGGSGRGMNGLTNLNTLADEKDFIVVYPDGYQRHWGDGRGTSPSERDGVDDVAFISALIDHLSKDLRVDPRRVYATGISNGGFFSDRVGCGLANKIAAIAVVAATMPTNLAKTCQPARPLPVQIFHGSDDPFVPSAGGEVTIGDRGSILSISDTVTKWAALDGCTTAPAVVNLPQQVNDGTQVSRETYNGCRGGTEVIFYDIKGGGHTWPGGLQYLPVRIIGKTTRNLDATTVIWAFFQSHPSD